MRHRFIASILYTALLLIAVSVTVLMYWLYSPPMEALSVSPNPVPVVNKEVKEDGTCVAFGYKRCVILKFTRCKNVRAEGRVVITLVGTDERIPLPVIYDREPRKCENDLTIPVAIPTSAQPGNYSLHFAITFKVNPVTTITQEYDTERFVVQ